MASEDLRNESSKIESWVSKDKNGQLQSSPEARKLAEKARVKYESKDAQDKLYREVFGSFTDKESYNANKGEPFAIDKTDSGTGLLEALAKRSGVLSGTFKTFPDTRLIAYQSLFYKFEAQGSDVNVLPMGSKVSLKEGRVTVEYPNGKKISALLFPWKDQIAPSVVVPKPSPIVVEAPVEVKAPTPVAPDVEIHKAPEMPMAPTMPPVATKKEEVKITPPVTPQAIEQKPVEKSKVIDVAYDFEDDWSIEKKLFSVVEQKYPQIKITDESSDYTIGFDRPKGSKKIMITNSITKERYILEVTPKKGAVNYADSKNLNFTVSQLRSGDFNARNEEKTFKFHGHPESLGSAINGVAEYTSEIHDNTFSLDTHITMSTTDLHDEMMQMNPKQKLDYVRSLLIDTKKKYERISKSQVTLKQDKVYLTSVQGEVNFLEKAYDSLHDVKDVWPDREYKSKNVDEVLAYFKVEFEKTNQ